MSLSPVEHILAEMKMLFGNLFDNQWKGVDYGEMISFWEKRLSGYTNDELRRGFNALEGLKYPPTLPEFMQLCRPPIDPMKAYHEAVKGVRERHEGRMGEWSHPAIFWASASMAYDLMNKPLSAVEAMWKSKLNEELSKTSWQPIPEISPRLPEPPRNREQGKKEYSKVLQKYGMKEPEARGNGRWVLRNFDRMVAGWKPVPAVRKCIFDAAHELGIPIPEKLLQKGAAA